MAKQSFKLSTLLGVGAAIVLIFSVLAVLDLVLVPDEMMLPLTVSSLPMPP